MRILVGASPTWKSPKGPVAPPDSLLMSSEGKRPVSLVLNSSIGRDGIMLESFFMFLWLNHGTQMSESPWVNVAFHVGVNRNVSSAAFIRGANIGLMAFIRF